MSNPQWGADLLRYLSWKHAVMKIGGSALATRFCAVKFTHLVEGQGDFEHKDHRIHALIEAVEKIGDVHQKLPPAFILRSVSGNWENWKTEICHSKKWMGPRVSLWL